MRTLEEIGLDLLLVPDMIDTLIEQDYEARMRKSLVDEQIREGQELWDIDGLDAWMEGREVDDIPF